MNPGQTIQELRDTGHQLQIRVKGNGYVYVGLYSEDEGLISTGTDVSISVALYQCLEHYREKD